MYIDKLDDVVDKTSWHNQYEASLCTFKYIY